MLPLDGPNFLSSILTDKGLVHEYDDAGRDPGASMPPNHGESVATGPDGVLARAAWHGGGLRCSSLEVHFSLGRLAMH